MSKFVTFEKYCKSGQIELKPWQREAARAFLSVMYAYRSAETGKTFLIKKLNEFISKHGNTFKV
jgi:hypothetical protein